MNYMAIMGTLFFHCPCTRICCNIFFLLLLLKLGFSSCSKRIINVGGPPSATAVPTVQNTDARVRVTCGHCNETFVVG